MKARRVTVLVLSLLVLLAALATNGCSKNPASPDGALIGNRNTHVVHSSSCSYLPDPQNRVSFDSCGQVQAAGYTSCGHCRPCG